MSDERTTNVQLKWIGVVHSPLKEPKGSPIQSVLAAGIEGTVEVFEPYEQGLRDLEGFERIWLIYWFHVVGVSRLRVVPFLDSQERGVFATRAPCRPNPIGMSPVRLLGIEGNVLRIGDVDIVDGTPVLDVKPYVPRFDSFPGVRSGWLDRSSREHAVADERFGCKRRADEE